jgi:N-sulfoglucosamine sulfohydrolase
MQKHDGSSLNVLLFTADDLGCDSLGCFGSTMPDISPHLDAFARESMRFENAHVNTAICMPSRSVLNTGRYSHNNGAMGFFKAFDSTPTIIETLSDAGYLTGVLGKVDHSTPKESITWDFSYDQSDLGHGRSPQKYASYCRDFFEACRNENKPFYLMVNSHDPHRPFYNPEEGPSGGAEVPSRLYDPDEIEVPGFLPDLPLVRKEVSWYYNSVKRLDDTFGAVMKVLQEAGHADDTLVAFLSDNGMAVPFAKCNTYFASTHTPWLTRWPGEAQGGSTCDDFISGIDFLPTVLDAIRLPMLDGMDGRSFVPLLKGEAEEGRDFVFTQIDSKAGGAAVPMRCVQNKQFGYIFNMWVRDEYRYRNNNEGLCMKAMEEAAKDDPAIAERVRMHRYRVPEELYDLEADPDCLNNLMDDPAYEVQRDAMRAALKHQMEESRDPVLEAFENRASSDIVDRVFRATYPDHVDRKKN